MKLTAFVMGTVAAAFLATPSVAANCAPRDTVIERLASLYGESRQSMGIGSNNSVVEVFASEDTGTWTITVTSAHGVTCLVASGQAFEALFEAMPTQDSDA